MPWFSRRPLWSGWSQVNMKVGLGCEHLNSGQVGAEFRNDSLYLPKRSHSSIISAVFTLSWPTQCSHNGQCPYPPECRQIRYLACYHSFARKQARSSETPPANQLAPLHSMLAFFCSSMAPSWGLIILRCLIKKTKVVGWILGGLSKIVRATGLVTLHHHLLQNFHWHASSLKLPMNCSEMDRNEVIVLRIVLGIICQFAAFN
jgi:hypothetical protein